MYVSEPGLYALIMKSKTQFAKTFQKFVYEQILPSIRKKGLFELEQQLAQKESQLQEEREYRLGLQESLLNNREPIEATQIIYIATSTAYSRQNRFKIGGTSNINGLEGRLATYNTGRANGDEFFYTDWFTVCGYRDVEKRVETLIGRFRDRKSKEMYILHYSNFKYIVEYIINHYTEEVEQINQKLEEFIKNLDTRTLRPVVVQAKPLNRIHIQRAGKTDVVITTNTSEDLVTKLELYIESLDKNTKSINVKQVFDSLNIKTARKEKYPVFFEIMKRLLPNTEIKLCAGAAK